MSVEEKPLLCSSLLRPTWRRMSHLCQLPRHHSGVHRDGKTTWASVPVVEHYGHIYGHIYGLTERGTYNLGTTP